MNTLLVHWDQSSKTNLALILTPDLTIAIMEISSNPVKFLEDELRRVELFYSFWDRR